jgi:hypothetical protein
MELALNSMLSAFVVVIDLFLFLIPTCKYILMIF